uniref:Xylulose kinase-1 n=1 Tax=Tanacetum cinerariifolium TaxID=118510 RepID=A0A699JAU5_TANCI|nr:xylulose kinase-1 [Tanacetum cinerariifolium]
MLLLELIFPFPCELRTSPGVPLNLDNRYTTGPQPFDLTIHNLYRYVVPADNILQLVLVGYVIPTGRVVSLGSKDLSRVGSNKWTRRDRDRRVIILPLTNAEEHIAVQRESKTRTNSLQSISDDHVVNFHYMDDARDIWNAVKARFGGNAESKKMRKSMLK